MATRENDYRDDANAPASRRSSKLRTTSILLATTLGTASIAYMALHRDNKVNNANADCATNNAAVQDKDSKAKDKKKENKHTKSNKGNGSGQSKLEREIQGIQAQITALNNNLASQAGNAQQTQEAQQPPQNTNYSSDPATAIVQQQMYAQQPIYLQGYGTLPYCINPWGNLSWNCWGQFGPNLFFVWANGGFAYRGGWGGFGQRFGFRNWGNGYNNNNGSNGTTGSNNNPTGRPNPVTGPGPHPTRPKPCAECKGTNNPKPVGPNAINNPHKPNVGPNAINNPNHSHSVNSLANLQRGRQPQMNGNFSMPHVQQMPQMRSQGNPGAGQHMGSGGGGRRR